MVGSGAEFNKEGRRRRRRRRGWWLLPRSVSARDAKVARRRSRKKCQGCPEHKNLVGCRRRPLLALNSNATAQPTQFAMLGLIEISFALQTGDGNCEVPRLPGFQDSDSTRHEFMWSGEDGGRLAGRGWWSAEVTPSFVREGCQLHGFSGSVGGRL